jgi:LmbE family N-acetylglucosaminyl deacetylase
VKTVVVSPHLDDAALSASARIGAGEVTVVTVFTGLPQPDLATSWWDRLTGAANSRRRQIERLAEDCVAMAELSARSVYLDEHEALYRDNSPLDLDQAIKRLAGEFADCGEVWLPAAIGGHRDHLAARDAGLRAATAAGHREVVLYADFPYVLAYGWPSWVTGEPADPFLDAGYWLTDQLETAGLDPAALSPEVTRLSGAQRAAKTAVIGAYRSQAAALGLGAAALARDPAKLDYELSWRMRLP